MSMNPSQFGYPIGKSRIIASIITSVLVGVLLFYASTNLKWFTLTRLLYLSFGVTAGLLLGTFEAKTVLSKLVHNNETLVWQVLPIGTALFGIPLLLIIVFFGVAEYLPFGLYAFLPSIPVISAASGWFFSKFENENKVMLFVFFYGIKYWKTPNPDASERFYYFVRDVVSRDFSLIPWHMGYSSLYKRELEKKEGIDPQTREELLRILKTMSKYRKIVLGGFALFLIGGVSLPILLFGSAAGVFKLSFDIVKVIVPLSGVMFAFLVGVYVLLQIFRRRVSRMLAAIDPDKLSSI